jgi:hypothetical protein
MSTHSSDDGPFADERQLRVDVDEAVERAVDQTLEDDNYQLKNVRKEKLAFLITNEFGLDLTYSWYIAGASMAAGYETEGTNSTDQSEPSFGNGQRTEFGSLDAQSDCDYDPDRVRRFTDYLNSQWLFSNYALRDVCYTQRHEFLHDFYDEFAPEAYKDAYFASTEIRRRLANLDKDSGRQVESTSLSEFGANERSLLTTSDEEAFRHTVSELHLALTKDEHLVNTTEVVTAGTDLIERVLDRLTRVQSLTSDQSELIEKLSEFFFYDVWRLPALVVSVQTVQGPNETELRVRHAQKLDGFREKMQRKRDNLRRQLTEEDLLPTIEDERRSDIGVEYEISLFDE